MKMAFRVLIFFLVASSSFAATNQLTYEMRGTSTTIWDQDIEEFSPPILLTRTSDTYAIHEVEFNAHRYEKYCAYYEERCTRYDARGNCVEMTYVCAQWDSRVTPVVKRIELSFSGLTALPKGQQESYELAINLTKPFDDGEDQVSTWFDAKAVLKPVRVLKMNEYSYSIDYK